MTIPCWAKDHTDFVEDLFRFKIESMIFRLTTFDAELIPGVLVTWLIFNDRQADIFNAVLIRLHQVVSIELLSFDYDLFFHIHRSCERLIALLIIYKVNLIDSELLFLSYMNLGHVSNVSMTLLFFNLLWNMLVVNHSVFRFWFVDLIKYFRE